MRVWLVTVGEPLPGLSQGSRPWRTGLLAEELVNREHEVTWWTSRFDHIRKARFEVSEGSLEARAGLTLRFLDGIPYSRNVSLRRLFNHWQLGRAFRRESLKAENPDVILCSFPTIELSAESVRYGVANRVPVLLDVRDLWPDIFAQAAPAQLRWLSNAALSPYSLQTRSAFSRATAITAVSRDYLDWGLAKAGRSSREMDRVVPLAYRFRGHEVEVTGTEVRQLYGIPEDAVLCLFAGTMGRTYDLGSMIESANQMATRGDKRFWFLVCGDGERRREWESRAAGNPLVKFTGWLEQVAMHNALTAADIGIAAYADNAPQGIPNKIIEYMGAGLPIIASLRGETEHLLSEHGCGIDYESTRMESFSGALDELESSEIRARMSRNCRELFASRFDADIVYKEFCSHLESVASAGAS